jgi:hypothetical protein
MWGKLSQCLGQIYESLNTPYGKYMGLDKLFLSEEMKKNDIGLLVRNMSGAAAYRQGSIVYCAMLQYFKGIGVSPTIAELNFNLSHTGISIEGLFVRRNNRSFHMDHIYDLQNNTCVSRGVKSCIKYVYLLRTGEQHPPGRFEKCFDMEELIHETETELDRYTPSLPMRRFARNAAREIGSLKIYKVRVD